LSWNRKRRYTTRQIERAKQRGFDVLRMERARRHHELEAFLMSADIDAIVKAK
jgi:hypothetical protein